MPDMNYIPGNQEPRQQPMGTPAYVPQQYPQHVVAPLPPKKHTTRNVLMMVIGAFVIACLSGTIGYAAGSGSTKTQGQGQNQAANAVYTDCPFAAGGCPSATPAAAKASPTPSPTPSKSPVPPPPPPVPSITDGTWTVGTDFPAGSYRTTADVDADCYWKISKSGTNGADIIQNDFPGGGRPQVTLKAGQDFTTNRCGTWHKVG